MDAVFLPGEPPLEIKLRRSSRARRLSLRISRLDGNATLTLPDHVPFSEAESFVVSKERWLRTHLDNAPTPMAITVGTALLIEGQICQVVSQNKGAVRLENGCLYVSGDADKAGRKVLGYLKVRARNRLVMASDHYAMKLGRTFEKIALRDTRSRWGSCSSEGALMYSWRLILAPPAVLDYVVAHEVAHLVEMNHSPQFWAVVEQLYPDYAAQRNWLRVHGTELHRYRFNS